MRIIGYVRTSTERQELSPEAQEATLRAWCAANGCELSATFSDIGTSSLSAIEDRPGLSAALAALRRGDVLIAAKRDRIARDPIIAAQAEYVARRAGARLVAADGRNDASPLEATIRRCVDDMVAAVELDKIRSRTRAALAAKRARGERVGSVPYGFRLADDGKRLEPVEAEQRVLSLARELRAAGMSLRAVARELAERGHVSRTGSTFAAVQVQRMIAA